VMDIRRIYDWLDDDLACRTVEDRLAMNRKHMGETVKELAVEPDRIRVVEDRDGDGKADHSHIFADGFNREAEGLAAGVLVRKGDVYFADIPNLWLLRDTKGTGTADVRKSLQYGYGVRVGFLGHDLHGLKFGPDGKLYFTIGDRGLNVQTPKGPVVNVESGSVLRCDPDGSNLELYATGLRNPQELAFDDFGNLFTGDNNCDKGDPARFVQVVEGGDSGWRVGYQHLNRAGAWNEEKLWEVMGKNEAAYIVPPVAHIGFGPSGLAYYPGTGLAEKYKGHFLLVDFRGGPSNSGVHSFATEPKGAGFEMVDRGQFVWNVLATDVEFAVDGGVYFTDWVNGWNKPMKGRIYKAVDPAAAGSAIVAETKKLIAEGMEGRPEAELVKLLGHADQRVRQEAQFELADRGENSIGALAAVAGDSKAPLLARVHAIWGLGQIGRKAPAALVGVVPLLGDSEAEVRAQAAKVLGDDRFAGAAGKLVELLKDPSERVRFFAAMGGGKAGKAEAAPAIFGMLKGNADKDAVLRHAGVWALTQIGDVKSIVSAGNDASPAVRMGALLALRRLGRPEVEKFLADKEPAIVLEAARAIHDVPIESGMPALAKVIRRKDLGGVSKFVLERAIDANYRLGGREQAEALVAFARRSDVAEELRAEALSLLGQWAKPSGRDRIVGLWRPLPERDEAVARNAAGAAVDQLIRGGSPAVRVAALELVEKFGTDRPEALFEIVSDGQVAGDVRAAALKVMASRNDPKLAEAVRLTLTDAKVEVRKEAIRQVLKLPDAMKEVEGILDRGTVGDRQAVLGAMAGVHRPAVDRILARCMDELLAGKLAGELQLDLLEAAGKSRDKVVKAKLKEFEGRRNSDDPLAQYRECLLGGDAAAGRKIFMERVDLSCMRCHTVEGQGGQAGPNLSGIGKRKPREYVLESIVLPNAQIAPGFDGVILKVKNGKSAKYVSGILKGETDAELTVDVPDKGVAKVAKADVLSRERGPSAMPEGLVKAMSKEDLRNVIEFLATSTEEGKEATAQGKGGAADVHPGLRKVN